MIVVVRRQLAKLRKLEAVLRQRNKPGVEDLIKALMLEYGRRNGKLTKEEEQELDRLNALIDSDPRMKMIRQQVLERSSRLREQE